MIELEGRRDPTSNLYNDLPLKKTNLKSLPRDRLININEVQLILVGARTI
jgi:hypothetical protein